MKAVQDAVDETYFWDSHAKCLLKTIWMSNNQLNIQFFTFQVALFLKAIPFPLVRQLQYNNYLNPQPLVLLRPYLPHGQG